MADFCDSDPGPIPLTSSPKDISTKCFTLKLSSYAALGKSKHWLEAQRQALPVRLNPVQICDHRCKLAGQDDSSLWSGSTHPHEQHSLYLFPCASKIVWHLHWFWARSSLQLPPCSAVSRLLIASFPIKFFLTTPNMAKDLAAASLLQLSQSWAFLSKFSIYCH